ncbi:MULTISPECIES: twin-arginine translocation signal domain-containing protein [Gordonia]|uniref:Twin-arginine translocation signal domain-containing protein n=1 Tax=Gordonia amicalis TaxID=89053 RepID=A0AAE4R4P4_9ACTN|nr:MULTISPECIES: twin-arginine translocation signal domain-containing protein [Gordonia]MBA5846465.1 twin-arginine translocation signal domain-containing protein [Gordonia amicalis]MDV6307144.1 twin-arginine translocation signal domain-containing protein [Gordonia amicalis]MDV6312974.1 twin-arginine translocation signal domain-containing protein [Gordonia amicalis]MDV7075930.1 twin-arginine translocation signal domain-containing protein [Gordonia amicalis]MDV7172498.1 twin-arginine translocati
MPKSSSDGCIPRGRTSFSRSRSFPSQAASYPARLRGTFSCTDDRRPMSGAYPTRRTFLKAAAVTAAGAPDSAHP